MAIWSGNGNLPTYSIYSQTDEVWSWSPTAVLGSPATTIRTRNINCCYDSNHSRIFVTFADLDAAGDPPYYYPYYAIYDGTSWSGPAQIAITPAYTNGNVYCCYNTTNDELFVSWCAENITREPGSGSPMYAVISYDSSTSLSMVDASLVFESDPSYYAWAAFPIYDNTNNTVMILFAGKAYPYYISYALSPNFGLVPTSLPSSSEAIYISGMYDATHNQFIASWPAYLASAAPTEAVYSSGTGWSSPSTISSTSQVYSGTPNICYISSLNAYMAVWNDTSTQQVAYSLYDFPQLSNNPFTTALIAKYGEPI